MAIRIALANNLRSFRKGRGLTQEQLAKQAKLTISFINKLEAGTMTVSLDNLEKIAHALDVPTHTLIADDSSPSARDTKLNVILADLRSAANILQRHINPERAPKRSLPSRKKKKEC